jgi:hypothetical protein
VSRLVDAGVWQLSLRHKTCRHNPKGFLGVGTAETRLNREVSSSEDSSSRGGTPDTEASEQRILSSHPGRSSPSALSTPASITHSPIPLLPPNYPLHNTNTPAPRSQLALPNASTGQPLYAHRDSINIQSTTPSQPFRKLWHRARSTTHCVRLATSCSSLPAPLSPLHAHRLPLLTGTCIDEHRLRKRRS